VLNVPLIVIMIMIMIIISILFICTVLPMPFCPSVCLSVCLSVKHMNCDKTKETFTILIHNNAFDRQQLTDRQKSLGSTMHCITCSHTIKTKETK